MISTKFQIDFGTIEAKAEMQIAAKKAKKTYNQFLLDCYKSKPVNDGRSIIAMNRPVEGDYLEAIEREDVIEIWSIREKAKQPKPKSQRDQFESVDPKSNELMSKEAIKELEEESKTKKRIPLKDVVYGITKEQSVGKRKK